MKVKMLVEVEIDVNENELNEQLCQEIRANLYRALDDNGFDGTVNDMWEE